MHWNSSQLICCDVTMNSFSSPLLPPPFFNLFLRSHTKIRLPNKHKHPFLPLVPQLITGNKHCQRGEKQSARHLAHRCFTYYRHSA